MDIEGRESEREWNVPGDLKKTAIVTVIRGFSTPPPKRILTTMSTQNGQDGG